MTSAFAAVVVLGVLSLTAWSTGRDAEPGCLPPDDLAASMMTYAVQLATDTDPEIVATRDAYGILPVPESEVELISHTQTCNKAGREYKKAVGLQGPAPDVHVIRIGTRYLVFDPATKGGEFVVHVVFDDQFNELATFGA